MTNIFDRQPFSSELDLTGCDPAISPNPSATGIFCGRADGCSPCDIDEAIFLNCHIVGFNGKLGIGGDESSISVDLIDSFEYNCPASGVCASTAPSCSPTLSGGYSGQLGHVYTFQLGGFVFRGILTNHQYRESNDGFRYTVTLSDARQVLGNVSVILNGYYSEVPTATKPNLINVLRELEPSVGDDYCGSGNKCEDFGESGANQKGILLKKALEAIDQKYCQIPISNACLIIDVSELIPIASTQYRVTSAESNVLELITLTCDEAGYGFYTKIIDNTIKVVPINKKQDINSQDLFQFMQDLVDNNIVISKEYGQELSFEKSKKLVFGDSYYYLMQIYQDSAPELDCTIDVEPSGVPCDATSGLYAPGAFGYRSKSPNIVKLSNDQIQEPAIDASLTTPCTGIIT